MYNRGHTFAFVLHKNMHLSLYNTFAYFAGCQAVSMLSTELITVLDMEVKVDNEEFPRSRHAIV